MGDYRRLRLEEDGAELVPGLLNASDIALLLEILPESSAAGVRIFENSALADWLRQGPLNSIVGAILGANAVATRAILFDKTGETNWSLGWHQDRTIALRKRLDVPGFDHWTVKGGVLHVEPPYEVLEGMITARIHLDPVPEPNAPLRIAPGSHLLGKIEEASILRILKQCGEAVCLAEVGDVWIYRTTILHASDRANRSKRRRVLQVDFAAHVLPGALEWMGVD